MNSQENREIFHSLYSASTESDVDKILDRFQSVLCNSKNWYPLDNNESNFGIIENQQSSPIAALIEKITNAIDAILMRRCYELGIDPKSPGAPVNMSDAVERFFDSNSNN